MDAFALLAEIARNGPITAPDTTALADVAGWDSLKTVRLVLRLEEIVGRGLSQEDIEGLISIRDVARLIESAVRV